MKEGADMGDLYFPPPGDSDAWERVAPEEAGWDAAGLKELFDFCEERDTHQLVILDRGRILAEEYWHGSDASSSGDIASAQKVYVSFLVGVLQARGVLSIDDPVSKWLGAGWSRLGPADEEQILVRHLISMCSGLYDDFTKEAPPGTVWYYNNNAYHQTRKVLEAATGRSTQELFDELLFRPLGMSHTEWQPRPQMKDPNGWVLSGLHSCARDMARFGLAVLAGGTWDGTALIEDDTYLPESLSPSQPMNPAYGYLWWLLGRPDAMVPGVEPGAERHPKKFFGGIALGRAAAPAGPPDLVAGLGAGDKKVYVCRSRGWVVTRHGGPGGERSAALSGFDNGLWERIMAVAPS